jgi:eukaryotic-like serine/threonine-protein kinase
MSHKSRRRISVAPSVSGGRATDFPSSGTHARVQAMLPGTMVAGRYRLEHLLASGAMGEVWRGVHLDLNMSVALKTPRRDTITDPEVVARFSREAFLLARVQSEHVVRVLDFVSDRRLGPVLVTELVDGVSLSAVLASRRFTVEEAIDLAVDLVCGLRELHQAHVIHRDVKPGNVIMKRTSNGGTRAVFIDLGVSRLAPSADLGEDLVLTEITSADRAVGTFESMAPEQILSSRSVTASADLYSVGAILFRATCGHNVFGETRGVELLQRKLAAPALPLETGRSDRVARGFEELVGRALAMAPGDRYEVADEMLAELSLLRDAARRASVAPKPKATVAPELSPAVNAHEHRGGRSASFVYLVCAALLGTLAGVLGASRVQRTALDPQAAPSAASAPAVSEDHTALRAPVCEGPPESSP